MCGPPFVFKISVFPSISWGPHFLHAHFFFSENWPVDQLPVSSIQNMEALPRWFFLRTVEWVRRQNDSSQGLVNSYPRSTTFLSVPQQHGLNESLLLAWFALLSFVSEVRAPESTVLGLTTLLTLMWRWTMLWLINFRLIELFQLIQNCYNN